MTICIAAICDNGHTVIICGDRELGISFTSADFRDGKWMPLYGQWSIGISGTVDNATDVVAVARRLRKEMETTTSWDVQSFIAKAYQQARMKKAEAKFIANRGWTLPDFKKLGAAQLSPSAYASMDAQVAFYDFNTDLILAGFDKDDEGPSILTVTNPGVCHDHTKLAFWCVGSGATAAQMSLFEREYRWSLPMEEAAYYVYEAKVAAQRATGVGNTTDIHLLKKGPDHLIIKTIQSDTMALLETTRSQLAPKKYNEEHHDILKKAVEFRLLRATP